MEWFYGYVAARRIVDHVRAHLNTVHNPNNTYRLVYLVVKASVSRAADPGFDSLFRGFFRVESFQRF